MIQEDQILILAYVIPLLLNLIYLIFYGDNAVKDVRTLLFSGYTLIWILPILNIAILLCVILTLLSEVAKNIKISKDILEKIDKFLNIKLPINRK